MTRRTSARAKRPDALVLPTLQQILETVAALPGDLRVGRSNNMKYYPLAQVLGMRYGGKWFVHQDSVSALIGSGEDVQLWVCLTPDEYIQVLHLLDDPDWRPGKPQKIIRALAFTAILRAVIAGQAIPSQQEDRGTP